MSALLAEHRRCICIFRRIDYDQWHAGGSKAISGSISANFTLPLDFLMFAHLCEVPLLQNCIPRDWRATPRSGAGGHGELVPAAAPINKTIVPLIHHWLIIRGQRSMRGLRIPSAGLILNRRGLRRRTLPKPALNCCPATKSLR